MKCGPSHSTPATFLSVLVILLSLCVDCMTANSTATWTSNTTVSNATLPPHLTLTLSPASLSETLLWNAPGVTITLTLSTGYFSLDAPADFVNVSMGWATSAVSDSLGWSNKVVRSCLVGAGAAISPDIGNALLWTLGVCPTYRTTRGEKVFVSIPSAFVSGVTVNVSFPLTAPLIVNAQPPGLVLSVSGSKTTSGPGGGVALLSEGTIRSGGALLTLAVTGTDTFNVASNSNLFTVAVSNCKGVIGSAWENGKSTFLSRSSSNSTAVVLSIRADANFQVFSTEIVTCALPASAFTSGLVPVDSPVLWVTPVPGTASTYGSWSTTYSEVSVRRGGIALTFALTNDLWSCDPSAVVASVNGSDASPTGFAQQAAFIIGPSSVTCNALDSIMYVTLQPDELYDVAANDVVSFHWVPSVSTSGIAPTGSASFTVTPAAGSIYLSGDVPTTSAERLRRGPTVQWELGLVGERFLAQCVPQVSSNVSNGFTAAFPQQSPSSWTIALGPMNRSLLMMVTPNPAYDPPGPELLTFAVGGTCVESGIAPVSVSAMNAVVLPSRAELLLLNGSVVTPNEMRAGLRLTLTLDGDTWSPTASFSPLDYLQFFSSTSAVDEEYGFNANVRVLLNGTCVHATVNGHQLVVALCPDPTYALLYRSETVAVIVNGTSAVASHTAPTPNTVFFMVAFAPEVVILGVSRDVWMQPTDVTFPTERFVEALAGVVGVPVESLNVTQVMYGTANHSNVTLTVQILPQGLADSPYDIAVNMATVLGPTLNTLLGVVTVSSGDVLSWQTRPTPTEHVMNASAVPSALSDTSTTQYGNNVVLWVVLTILFVIVLSSATALYMHFRPKHKGGRARNAHNQCHLDTLGKYSAGNVAAPPGGVPYQLRGRILVPRNKSADQLEDAEEMFSTTGSTWTGGPPLDSLYSGQANAKDIYHPLLLPSPSHEQFQPSPVPYGNFVPRHHAVLPPRIPHPITGPYLPPQPRNLRSLDGMMRAL